MLISIIIVNYNVTAELDNCVHSIIQNINHKNYEILVVDNNSPDRSIEHLQYKYPSVKFFFFNNNIGFSKANNFAVSKSGADYLLILNPDTLLIEDFITPMIQYIKKHNNTGACAPMLLYRDMSYQNSAGDKMGLFYESAEALFYINLYRILKKKLNPRKFNGNEPFKVGWISGACLLLKRRIFEEIGGFNTEFFMNYEDIDLCKRIEDLGYSNYYFPFLKCIHLDQTSQKKNYENLVLNRYKSRMIYAKHHYNSAQKLIVLIIHIIGIIVRILLTPLLYKGDEKQQRGSGYRKALKILIFNSK